MSTLWLALVLGLPAAVIVGEGEDDDGSLSG